MKGPVENVWFAAVSEAQKLVVVAVAGTALVSLRDWFDDFDVARVVNFDNWVGQWKNGVPAPTVDKKPNEFAHAYCANGTATGVYNILSNKDPGSDTMGGVLSPTLALGLRRANMIGNSPDVKSYAMPSAGPTQGNTRFVAAYTAAYPLTPNPDAPDYAKVSNGDLFNTNDIVPQAWSIRPTDDQSLERMTGAIYTFARLNESLKLYVLAAWLVGVAIYRSASSKVFYQPIPPNAFTPADSLPPIIDLALGLAKYIVLNHTYSYWVYIGINGFVTEFNDHVVAQPGVEEPPAASLLAVGLDIDEESCAAVDGTQVAQSKEVVAA
ncbi:hypothetical protein LZ31DRAFT_627556 [Colletotrichum somersetense]|nr:hypothetical protein LZ31DRAFT_627556 [Colletotrichum somersetense]